MEFIDPFIPSDDLASSAVTQDDYREGLKNQYHDLEDIIKYRAGRRLELYRKLLGRVPSRILDVGAGTGWMVKGFNDHGVKAIGLECDPELAAVGAQLGAEIIQGDICTCDLTELEPFDILCSSQTVEHILFPKTAVARMADMLKPGGFLHIDVPNAASWGAKFRRYKHNSARWGVITLPHHQVGYFSKTLTTLFHLSGLEISHIGEYPTDHSVYGQVMLPTNLVSKLAILGSKFLGHGYLLVGIARKVCGESRNGQA